MVRKAEAGIVPHERDDSAWLTSVGIDIGTSTTKMIISKLKLARTSGALSLPRYEITERRVVYESPIVSTPLRSADEVDAESIGRLIAEQYAQAGIMPSELKTGAVIITGETANKKNAQQMLHLLAERAGDFVVATAGADLEGLLAGRGAGADARSRELRSAIANIDIGGGTANTAYFRRGKPVGTVTFHVGGRLIQVDGAGTIQAISPSIRPWLDAAGYQLSPGDRTTLPQLWDICMAMSRDMLDCIAGVADNHKPAVRALLQGMPLATVPEIEAWTFSGGIGRLMAEPMPASLQEAAVHGDIGPILAQAVKQQAARYPDIRLEQPLQTVRATVIGAGMQSTEISGATVHLDATLLPMRNLPVLKLALDSLWLDDADRLTQAVAETFRYGAELYDPGATPPFALALSGMQGAGYEQLQRLAGTLTTQYQSYFPESDLFVAICENDMAKALGQSLESRFGGKAKVVCIDQIRVELGDYVDLGEPISGTMIPVVVKTLAFNK
jgi:ethanolamine utilization protein EutA